MDHSSITFKIKLIRVLYHSDMNGTHHSVLIHLQAGQNGTDHPTDASLYSSHYIPAFHCRRPIRADTPHLSLVTTWQYR